MVQHACMRTLLSIYDALLLLQDQHGILAAEGAHTSSQPPRRLHPGAGTKVQRTLLHVTPPLWLPDPSALFGPALNHVGDTPRHDGRVLMQAHHYRCAAC